MQLWTEFRFLLKYKPLSLLVLIEEQAKACTLNLYSIDLPSKVEIKFGQATPIVSRHSKFGVAPTKLDIRMMVGRFGKSADFVHKIQARRKIRKLKTFHYYVRFGDPSIQSL